MRDFPNNHLAGMTIFSVLLLLPSFTPPVFATTLIDQPFKKMVHEAEQIFEGVVTSKHSERSKNGKTMYTFVQFSELSPIKGNIEESTITLRLEGGQAGNNRLSVEGMPEFNEGEKVIVFVRKQITDKTICPILGWEEGQFKIKFDPEFNKETIEDGLGRKITDYDANKGELITAAGPRVDRPTPIPVNGTTDKLVVQQEQPNDSNRISKEDFILKIQEIMKEADKNQPQGISGAGTDEGTPYSLDQSSEETEAVSPPGVNK